MDSEKPIKCVKNRPILYQSTKKAYNETATKDAPWQEIGTDIGEGVTGMYRPIFKCMQKMMQVT